MSFTTALSGLNAASADLNITSNNIANVGSTGFKASRAEFSDVYAVTELGTSQTSIGAGTALAAVRQTFLQGNLEFTERSLDLSITGRGFFIVSPNATSNENIFTRSGAFGVDSNGFVVNSSGQFLQVFPANDDGTVTSTSLNSASRLQVPQSFGTPTATTEIDLDINLPAEGAELTIADFDPTQPSTYNQATSLTVFDSLGASHTAEVFYIKTSAATNTWETRLYIDGQAVPPAATENLAFTQTGNVDATVNESITYAPFNLSNGAAALNLVIDYSDTTQFSADFSLSGISQNGSTTGRLTRMDVGENGIIRANFSNGQELNLGKIALGDFRNPEGLRQLGDTAWAESPDSGEVLTGEAGSGTFGDIAGGALETSNVELTSELVRLITAQRNFQANAKAIETNNSITQAIIQI